MDMNKDRLARAGRFVFLIAGPLLILLGLIGLASGYVDDLLHSLTSLLKRKPLNVLWLWKLQLLAVDCIVCGVALIISRWLAHPRWRLTTAIILLLALWVPAALVGQSAIIGGERYWWLHDDAMISMRYAHNAARGLGLVWNPGEWVQGYSNFLWTLYMVFVHLLPLPVSKTSLVILITNLVIATVTLPIVVRLVRILGGGQTTMVATLLGCVLSANMMVWATSGFETTFLTFVFLLALYRVLQESQSGQPRPLTYLLIASMALIRADALVLTGLLYGLSLLSNVNRKMVLYYTVFSLPVVGVEFLFRLYYYGDLLPNTAYLKAMSLNGRYIGGLKYLLEFVQNYALLLVCLVIGFISCRERVPRLLAAAFALYAAYVVFVGGDCFLGFRFFIPFLPIVMLLAFLSIQRFAMRPSLRLATVALCLVTMPVIVPRYRKFLIPAPCDIGNIKIALLLKENTPLNIRVADFWAGSVFYFSERYGVDLLGKSDRYVAHLPLASEGTKPGHNKFDFDYSLRTHQPDIVIAAFKLPVDEEKMRLAATGDWAFKGRLYFNGTFREHCLPYPVDFDTWRTIFVCDWSPLARQRENWKGLPGED